VEGSGRCLILRHCKCLKWAGLCQCNIPESCFVPEFHNGTYVSRELSQIVSGFGLEDRAIEVRSPAEANRFFLYLCPGRLWGPPSPCKMGTEGPFPELKRGQGVKLTAHPHLVPRSRMSRSYTSCPPKRLRGLQWSSFSF
jgi:hypothetical protein